MAEKKLMKGNEAFAAAAINAGCRYYFGYPITPQSEVPEYMSRELKKAGGAFIQAESELGAINMAYGASAAGGRVLITSSSPGIALMQESIGLLCSVELPVVIINVMRGGPGIGSIQPGQADYNQVTRGGSNGDYHTIVLAPNSIQEAIDMIGKAFDLADEYRNPVIIAADGMLGQMMEPVELPEHKDRKLPEKPWAACGHENKREHNIINSLYLTPNALEDLVRARYERYKIVEEKEQRAEEYRTEDADVIVVAYGASSRVARSAVNKAREAGKKVGLIRPITLWPFPKDAIKRAADHTKELLVVEMSMGQMVDDVRLAAECRVPVHFYGRTGGVIPTPKEILGEIDKLLK